MTKRLHKLNARTVATIAAPGCHSDGGGLYLLVRARRELVERLWLFQWSRGQRNARSQRALSLGPARDVGLGQARELAAKCRAALAAGDEPRTALARVRGVLTFGEVADRYLKTIAPTLDQRKTLGSWRLTLSDTYCRALRRLPVDRLSTEDVLAAVKPVWTAKPDTGKRLRLRIEKVLDHAAVAGERSGANPARWAGHLEHLLAKPASLTHGHHAALPWQDMPAFMAELRAVDTVPAFALRFLILTAARTDEVRGATWPEIDLERRLWIIPGKRMKAGKEHRVPLGDRALELLELARQLGGVYVFPGRDLGRPLSHMPLPNCLHALRPGATVHGFRSSFRDWAGEATSFAPDLAEAALAHVAGSVERAYRRGDALERRRELMSAWERFCNPVAVDNVTPLRRAT